MRKGVRNETENLWNTCYVDLVAWDCDVFVCVLVVLMNELITREMVEVGCVSDEILDMVEEYRTLQERMETFKFEFKRFCEENGFNKWETDYFTMNYIGETDSVRVDTKKMKSTDIFIADALTGEMEKVNAYEFFSYRSPVKAHVTFKEKK